MYEFGYTFKDVEELYPSQVEFLFAGLDAYYKDQKKAYDRARRRRR